ncbi:MAG: BatA domain-containing protein [Haloarculaceae archaeon]
MALSDVFLSPLGLAAAALAVPVVLLYLIRPDPERVTLPTFRFLAEEERQRATQPLLERLSRSLLLAIQVLAIVALAGALAAPYVPVSERAVVEETILVVDTSASMATTDDGQSRFDRAVAAAREEATSTTSVVTTAGGGTVALRRGPPSDTERTLDELAVTDAPGDLAGAVAQARALAGENARIVVLSDFAGEEWPDAVRTTRAQGTSVVLRQFGDAADNVGFVDRRFSGPEVTLSVKNFGDSEVTRTVRLGDQAAQLTLGPEDVGSVTFDVPAGGGRATLSPGDAFATDDAVAVAAPADPTVDVLVLTNDRNRFLTTALDVLDQVDLTVDNPPTTVEDEYDVVVYSNVDDESLLPGNVATGETTIASGGGVAVQAQENMPDYGGLSLVEPESVGAAPTVRRAAESELTRGIDFQPPEGYLTGELREGEALVEFGDGSPLVATARRGPGRLLYYGYIEERSSFKFNYQYPVFWKRAVFFLADRGTLAELNHETGETVRFSGESVDGPDGQLAGPTVTLTDAGFYATESRRESASLLDERESSVAVAPIDRREEAVGNLTRTEQRTVPRRLTEFAVVVALLLVVLEVAYLRRRGDL